MIAHTIARLFHSGDVIILDGELGAGKTYFVKGFATGLHAEDPVSSPTFSIANFYRTKQTDLLHIDLYRIATMDEFTDLGLFDYFNQTITLIEWGMKFADYLEACLMISFFVKDDHTRVITFSNHGDKYMQQMNEIKQLLKGDALC